MNHRLTAITALAVVLASLSEFSVIYGTGWLLASAGAVAVVALAGTLTRLAPGPAAVGATALAIIASIPALTYRPPLGVLAAGLVVAGCAASASRLRLLHAFATLVTYLAALLLYLNAALAGRQSFAHLIPTAASLRHLRALVSVANSVVSGSSPPVPGLRGVVLVAAAGIGLVAIAVDLLSVRLRKPAIAGLPLLVLYMAPIATTAKLGGVGGAVGFLIASAGFLAMLAADGRDRLRGWGRVITVWHQAEEEDRAGGAEVSQLAATGRRIGAAAIGIAVIAPLVLPGLHMNHGLGHGNGPGGPAAGPAVPLPNPLVQLRADLSQFPPADVLSYRTNAINPQDQYLQTSVLNYDPGTSTWKPVPFGPHIAVTGKLASAPGVTQAVTQETARTVVTFGNVAANSQWTFLPVPYAPAALNVSGSWLEDADTLAIYSGVTRLAGLNYTVTSDEAEPTAKLLSQVQHPPDDVLAGYMAVPTGPLAGQLISIARTITKGKKTAIAKAQALQNWFQSGRFIYNTRVNLPNSTAGLVDFLTRRRQGFCQQFAFAMAVLARLVGLPSRIAVGYTAGNPQTNGSWQITTADAHAWPELYFSGVGWIRFEPTPGGPGAQGTAVAPAYASTGRQGPGGTPGPSTGPVTSTGKPGPHNSQAHAAHPGAATGHLSGGTGGSGRNSGVAGAVAEMAGLVLAGLLILAAAVPGATRLLIRRNRWRRARTDAGLADAAWLELCDDLDDLGMTCLPSESPRTVARRVGSAAGDDAAAQQAANRIAVTVERAKFGPTPAAAGPIRADVTIVRRAVARDASAGARLRAWLLPASAVRPAVDAARRTVAALTGWIPAASEDQPV